MPIEACEDAAHLARLHEAAFALAWTQDAFEGLLARPAVEAFANSDGFILMQNLGSNEDANEAEILTLAVTPSARRSGLGLALFSHALAALSCTRVFLEVAADNHAALALYEKLGFTEIGLRKAYYKTHAGAHVDGVMMQGDFPKSM